MKRILMTIACLLALCALSPVLAADGYLVQIPEARLPYVRALGVELEPACEDIYLLRNEKDLAGLRSAGVILYSEPNETLTLEANSWNIEQIHAAAAWDHRGADGQPDRRGDGVTVAIVDSGVDTSHEDLDPSRILPYKDYGSSENGVDIWHGTFVAGIIAARLDNDLDIDGVAPNVTLLPVTITSNGTSDTFTAIRGIQYAADNGADVINLSIGGGASSAFLERTCRSAADKGVILVAAAGNYKDGETPSEKSVVYPAGYDFVVSVSSCKQTVDGPAFADEYSYFNSSVDICAPGSKIRSLYTGGSTALASGTSFAAPMVSAMAAVAKQTNPAINTEIFLSLLEATSTDLGEEGRDIYYGMGLVDMGAFIEKLDESYPIRFFSGDEPAQFDAEAPDSYTIADGEILLPEPVRQNYRFLGWYEDPGCTGAPVTAIPTASMGERSFYAKWEALPNEPPAVTQYAPAEGAAKPASLDGLTSATPYSADVSSWFADPDGDELTFSLISDAGSLDGSGLVYIPGPADAQTDTPLTIHADDGFGHTAAHTVVIHVDALPPSQPTLADPEDMLALDLCRAPKAVSVELALFGAQVTAVRLADTPLTWKLNGQSLSVDVPDLAPGTYELSIEFDMGTPVTWPWHVYYGVAGPAVSPDAPAQAEAVPGVPFAADVRDWFSGEGLQYSLAAGPGRLDGAVFTFTPDAGDADTEPSVTVRAADAYGRSVEHTMQLRVGPAPAGQPALDAGPLAMTACRLPKEARAALILNGAQLTSARLGEAPLDWRQEDGVLIAAVPELSPGDYQITLEFDAGEPLTWDWQVRECPSAVFRDVPLRTWYHSAVDWAVENKLMNGMASDRFEPQGDFTRAMLVTVLYRAAGKPAAPETSPFADVAPGKWYAKAVAWAAREGIVNGMAPDRFAPDAPITREQLVTILFRYARDDGVRADLNAFPDADSVSKYARTAMAWAVGHGIVNGVGSGGSATLSPRDGATRAQVAAIMQRYLTNDQRTEATNDD